MPNFGSSRLGYWFNSAGASDLEIDSTTDIYVIGDTSGTINTALPTLQSMVSGALKTALLEYYGSEANYDSRVTYSGFSDERTFSQFQSPVRNAQSTRVISIIFQDENSSIYGTYGRTFSVVAEEDVNSYKTYLSSQSEYFYLSILIPVFGYSYFPRSMNAAFNGVIAVPSSELATATLWKEAFDPSTRTWRNVMSLGSLLVKESTEEQFTSEVISSLNNLGFSLNV